MDTRSMAVGAALVSGCGSTIAVVVIVVFLVAAAFVYPLTLLFTVPVGYGLYRVARWTLRGMPTKPTPVDQMYAAYADGSVDGVLRAGAKDPELEQATALMAACRLMEDDRPSEAIDHLRTVLGLADSDASRDFLRHLDDARTTAKIGPGVDLRDLGRLDVAAVVLDGAMDAVGRGSVSGDLGALTALERALTHVESGALDDARRLITQIEAHDTAFTGLDRLRAAEAEAAGGS